MGSINLILFVGMSVRNRLRIVPPTGILELPAFSIKRFHSASPLQRLMVTQFSRCTALFAAPPVQILPAEAAEAHHEIGFFFSCFEIDV
jgi:hypothetical protein